LKGEDKQIRKLALRKKNGLNYLCCLAARTELALALFFQDRTLP